MRFVDTVEILAKAGDGGPGAVSFRREKFVPRGGPDGGDGGSGGSVVLVTDRRLQTLMDFKLNPTVTAPKGESGHGKKCSGSDGQDIRISVPVGTVIWNEWNDQVADLTVNGTEFVIARGGKGGKGNFRFKSSVNQAPTYAQPGLPGEVVRLRLELKLLAHVGLIGFPNAGKSTLLNALTQANPKIAAYPFTTLFPNLGLLKWADKELVIADIPGIIAGASQGAGLGLDFLRHVERTQLLVHLVTADPPDSAWDRYCQIQTELANGPIAMDQRPQLVVISKCDELSDPDLQGIITQFKSNGIPAFGLSSHSRVGVAELIQKIRYSGDWNG